MIQPTQTIIPPLLYGTAWKKDRTCDLVIQAVEAGFRGIDTACQPKHYNEAQVGDALQKLAEKGIERFSLYVQTKFTPLGGQNPNHIPYDPHAPLQKQIFQSFARSQQNLQTDYVDCLILHSPLSTVEETIDAWRAMEQIHSKGGTKSLGISNCYYPLVFSKLYEAAHIKPNVLQNRFYQESGYDKELRLFCQQHDITYESFWTLTANPHILGSKSLFLLSKQYKKTPAQIFFRFLTQCGIVPLTGTCDVEHMQEDLNIFDFELSDGEREMIDQLLL